MSTPPFTAPTHRTGAFNCPHCHAYSSMHWGQALSRGFMYENNVEVNPVTFARCANCNDWSIWVNELIIYPKEISVEDPNDDLPEQVKMDYNEAALILSDSPRGAGALLRLAIQKLCDSLVEGDADLNSKIGTLVSNGLDNKVQQALDSVRVIGNEAVHPGQIDFSDTPEIVNQLFKLINLIGRRMITEPKEVEEIYNLLPPSKIAGIVDRDKPKK